MRRLALLALLLAPCAAFPAAAQAVAAPQATDVSFSSGSDPDTVTIGDRFRVLLGVTVPPGTRVELPSRPDSAVDLESLGPGTVRSDPARGEFAVTFPMVAWRPGALARPYARVLVRHADGRGEAVRVPLKVPFVRSVLPPDTTGVRPRGPRDVIGPSRDPLLLALLAALAALVLGGTGYLAARAWRRRKRRPVPGPDPRAGALAELDRIRRLGLMETEEWKAFYTLVSEAVRGYLAALSPRWGTDLTTWEVLEALGEDGVEAGAVERLAVVLREADRVKFARGGSSAAAAERHWSEARRWVEGFDPSAARRAASSEEVAR